MDGLPLFTEPTPHHRPAPPRVKRRRGATRLATSAGRPWPLDGAINVVLFAGMGGACQGLEDAGFPVHVAVNHDAIAIAAHRALNPHTRHLCADIYEVDPLEATGRRPVNILWASPDCRDHSVAKGGAPRSPRVRSMPWQVCRWIGTLRRHGLGPQVIYLENVREIRGWGPLIAKRDKATGRVIKLVEGQEVVAEPGERVPRHQQSLTRDPKRQGRTYRRWVRHIEGLGIRYEDRDLNCAEYGVPTSRKRLFGVGVTDGRPIVWPPITHGPRTSPAVMNGTLLPFRAAAEIIVWSRPLPSIFGRPRDLSAATQRRIALGIRRFIIDAQTPYLIHTAPRHGEAMTGATIIPTTHSKSPPRAHDGQGPVPTLTAGVKGGEMAIMAAHLTEFRSHSVGHDVTMPSPTLTQVDHHGITAAFMVKHNSGVIGNRASDPISTITTTGSQIQVAAAFLVHQRGTGIPHDIRSPLSAVTAGGSHHQVIAAHLTEYYGSGGQHQGVDAPLNTITTLPRFAVTGGTCGTPPLTPDQIAGARRVAHFLRRHGAWDGGDIVTVGEYAITDLVMRMLWPDEAAAAHELTMPAAIRVPKLDRQGRPIMDGSGRPMMTDRPLTKAEAMRLVGNSVPKRMAMLLAQANAAHALDIPAQAQAAE